MKILKHVFAVVLGFISCCILVAIVLAGQEFLVHSRSYKDQTFDAEKWKSADAGNVRLQMMSDLQHYYISRGMTLDELTALLGKPDGSMGDSLIRFEIGSTGILSPNETLFFKVDVHKVVEDFGIEK